MLPDFTRLRRPLRQPFHPRTHALHALHAFARRRHLFLSLLLVTASVSERTARAADTTPDPHIAAVESGLLPPAVIVGRPHEPWTLSARMEHYHVPGVSLAVIDHGEIAWTRAYGVARAGDPAPVTPDTLFQAASISKPITAAAALTLVESGRLPLDADINPLLKSWKIPAAPVAENEPVTLRRLLSHTAGLNVHGFAGYAAGTPLPTLLQILDGTPPANSAPIRLIAKPGSLWRYSGGGYCIVQQLLLDLTGEPFPAFVHTAVLAPTGMTASTFAPPPSHPSPSSHPSDPSHPPATGHDSTGQPIPGDFHLYPALAAAGLWTTPTDLARFALALSHSLDDSAGPKLFSRATAETMIAVPLAGSDYGLGIGVTGAGQNLQLRHDGANAGFRAMLVLYPRRAQGAVIMTNSENGGALITELLRALARAYDWPDYRVAGKTAYPLPPDAFDAFAGRYEREDTVLLFYRKDDHFYLRATNQPRREIFPSSDHEFFLLDSADTYDFQHAASGETTHVIHRTPTALQLFPRIE
jgi:CubicO group peptidase (beta-lactamase class C family)